MDFSPEIPLNTEDWFTYEYLEVADFDGDGDQDVLITRRTAPEGVVMYENDGSGKLGTSHMVDAEGLYHLVLVADLDSDGDDDVLTDRGGLGWFENGLPFDCNGNGIPDNRDIMTGFSSDCNGNGIPDSCDIGTGTSLDCNGNGLPDDCDLAAGTSFDIDGDGQLDDCVIPALVADVYELGITSSGTQTFTLTAPVASDLYVLLGTASGTSPGTLVQGLLVPLNIGSYTQFTVTKLNLPPYSNTLGNLTPTGSGGAAVASLSLPPNLPGSLVGFVLHHAYVTFDNFEVATFVSNPVPLTITL